jgi:hypothetical protein
MPKIDFELMSEYGKYRDAIVLPENHNLSDSEMEAIKNDRFEAWKSHISLSLEEPQE